MQESNLPLTDAPALDVLLSDGTRITSTHIVQFQLIIAGDTRLHASARVVDNLSHHMVLGMDWLRHYNPAIDWVSYAVTFLHAQVRVECLPTRAVARVEL